MTVDVTTARRPWLPWVIAAAFVVVLLAVGITVALVLAGVQAQADAAYRACVDEGLASVSLSSEEYAQIAVDVAQDCSAS